MLVLTTVGDHLDAIAERMIPPSPGWPGATVLRVGDLIVPELRESEWTLLESALERLGTYEEFLKADGAGRDDMLRRLEREEPGLFDVLQRIVYLGYYAHPDVLVELRRRGYDINDAPQPDGYRMAPLDPVLVPVDGPGHWIATADVHRLTNEGI